MGLYLFFGVFFIAILIAGLATIADEANGTAPARREAERLKKLADLGDERLEAMRRRNSHYHNTD